MASNSSLDLAMNDMALSNQASTTTKTSTTSSSSASILVLPTSNRPNATWAEHMSLPFDSRYNLSEFTFFQQLPPEVRRIIWEFSALPGEIISIELIRPIVFEKGTNKTKLIDGQKVPRQFSIKYRAFGVSLNMDGTYINRSDGKNFVRSGQLGACKESDAIYKKAKPNFVRLLKTTGGGKIWFNPETDTLAIPPRTRFNLDQLRQRRRPKIDFFTGFPSVKRVAFEDQEGGAVVDTLRLLSEQIRNDFAKSIAEIEEKSFGVPDAKYHKDENWTDAVDLEQQDLGKELKRARVAITKVNGAVFSEEVKQLFFPLTEKDLKDEVAVESEEGTEGDAT